MKKEYIIVGFVAFVFFCLFLFYTRLEIQRLIAIRVQSAHEVSRTANDYLRLVKRTTMNVKEEGGILIYESFGNDAKQ